MESPEKIFKVSVIVPVYNSAGFIRQAVESALLQPQTAEVVLVEDGSADNSWEVCQQLAAENAKIHLYRHADGGNHGSGATRNVAICQSTCEFIAFLDADDFFLPGRFDRVEQMFAADPQLEGVYEAIGTHVEDENSLQRWKSSGMPLTDLHTMTKRVAPEELFAALVNGGSGNFSIIGVVIKRSLFEKTGPFDEGLRLHQDIAFILKAAAVCRLAAGKLDEPVTMRRVHDHNRISAPRSTQLVYKTRLAFWSTMWEWGRLHLDREKQQLILQAMLKEAARRPRFTRQLPGFMSGFRKSMQLLILPFEYPFMFKERAYWLAFRDAFPTIPTRRVSKTG
jgi:glycosyltransferase involved in cell wall biosynthesis